MPRRTGLGKGLEALIPGGNTEQAEGSVTFIGVDKVAANPRQPRAQIDPADLTDLAASIREHGVLQPLIVMPGPGPEHYTLIAGERRLRAAQLAGLTSVPALIRPATDEQLVELALIENVQRADLSPLETARAYSQLAEEFGLTHEEIALRVGKSRPAVTNTLNLLTLPEKVQAALAEGKISEGHAKVLFMLSTEKAQLAVLEMILEKHLSVRQTEDLVHEYRGQRTARAPKAAPPAEITALEERLRNHLGTRVTLRHGEKGGSLVIHYYSDEELNALISQILGE